MKCVTMRDIAQSIGVSIVTVSKALSGNSGVSEETREKIKQRAEEMGYTGPTFRRPENRKLDIGVLIPLRYFKPDTFYSMLYLRLVQELKAQGHFCLFETLDEEAEEAGVMPDLIRSRHVDGMIILGEPIRSYIQALAGITTPLVFMDFYDDRATAPAVVGDNTYGSYRLTSHLIKNGHKDIGFVGKMDMTSSIMDRFLGFYRAMLVNCLTVRTEWIISDRDIHGKLGIDPLPEKLPTAFVCNCDLVAHQVMELLQERGYRIPEDISIVGFDDYPVAPPGLPEVSTFCTNYDTMVQATVKLMIDRCNGVDVIPNRMVIGGHPHYKESDASIPRR